MAGEVNWKAKYTELKAKYMESVEVAFRLGFEQGAQQAQNDNAMMQQQQGNELKQAALGGIGQPGSPGGPSAKPGESGPNGQGFSDQETAPNQPAGPGKGIEPMKDSEHPDGSELDQHIAKLESMISKSEDLDVSDLKKTVNDIKSLQKYHKEQSELRKSQMAIPEIAKALHRPQFKLSAQANHNMSSNAKTAVNMQHRIVNDIMHKWEQEEKNASKDILSQLNVEGLTKKENE